METLFKNILVVDDNEAFLSTLYVTLKRMFREVHCAENGQKALDMIGKSDYEFLLTDINMENMNGLELANIIKTDYPQMKIILMSSYYTKEDITSFSFLSKPFSISELYSMIEEAGKDN